MLGAMDPNVSTLERAFQLAATGRYLSVKEIKLQLSREGYRYTLVYGRLLANQLLAIVSKARAERVPKPRKSK